MSSLAVVIDAVVLAGKVCPVAPPGAEAPTQQIEGYVLWGVGILFGIAVIVAIGAIIAGRVFGMPHASKIGVISIVVVFVCVVAYLVLPGMVDTMLGKGCI
jgi:hypothetical protein